MIPHTRLRKARSSSSVLRNSTHEALMRNSRWATSPRRGRSAPGSSTGMTWNASSRARLSMATWSSCFCHGPRPFGPRNTTQVLLSRSALGQRRLELPAGGQLPFLQVQLQALALEPLGHLVDGRAVLGVVRQERVVALRPEGRHRGTLTARRRRVEAARPPCACLRRRPSISGVSMPPRCYPDDTLVNLDYSMILCSLLAHLVHPRADATTPRPKRGPWVPPSRSHAILFGTEFARSFM